MPRYDKVLKSMQDKIRSGEWAAGEMIPREIDLCAMYDVSRSTIRMAMSRLVDAGALTRVKGMGTYVTGKQSWKVLRCSSPALLRNWKSEA